MDCIDHGVAESDATERLSLLPPFFPQHMTKSLFGHRHFHIVIIEEYAIYIDQGIFLTQGSNPCLRNCRRILYHLSHQGTSIYDQEKIKGAKFIFHFK